MTSKHKLKTFIQDIERIVSGKQVPSFQHDNIEPEYRDILTIARMLTDADYSDKAQEAANKLKAKSKSADQLEDEDLDLVAGGTNTNALEDEYDKERR
ncbi:MAG: hypothetical protein PHD40_02180 [Syntrophomonadaceae bacterium]|nr:hypothetical protein [Syntrophomonadaceae bacterium]